MSWLRPLGSTGLEVSALGLGTVKLGRDQGVKYPGSFTIPDRRQAASLLAHALDLGINLIDTAPAYGNSEERLGSLLQHDREKWVICSKVGEEYSEGKSHFDFSPEHTHASVRRTLARLNTDVVDIVLVHSDGDDMRIIEQYGTLEALAELKTAGLIRAFGMSTKTVAGGLAAVPLCDIVMLTYNLLTQDEEPVLRACQQAQKGGLIKKALASGHSVTSDNAEQRLLDTMQLLFSHPGTSSAIVGTINPSHLEHNVSAVRRALEMC